MAMELKHFSHSHGLVFHQAAPGSEVHCSGCKSPGSGNVYACWKCNYFLHDHCFRASRTLAHPSHPLHPLTLLSYPTYPSSQFFCNSCSLPGTGFCYCCSDCDFDVHVHCAHAAAAPDLSRSASVPLPTIANAGAAQNFGHHNHVHVYPPPPVHSSPFPPSYP